MPASAMDWPRIELTRPWVKHNRVMLVTVFVSRVVLQVPHETHHLVDHPVKRGVLHCGTVAAVAGRVAARRGQGGGQQGDHRGHDEEDPFSNTSSVSPFLSGGLGARLRFSSEAPLVELRRQPLAPRVPVYY